MKRISGFLSIPILLLLVIGCSTESEGEPEGEETAEVEAEEVTLIWAANAPSRFEYEKEAIEEKFPHITIEIYHAPSERENLQEMLAAQVHPDIISTYNAYRLPVYMESQLAYDLDPLIEKHEFDLNRIEPGLLSRIRSYAPNQELFMLPYEPDLLALYYNKDIFDLFGVEYPTDGMTWNEVLDLARQLTRGRRDSVSRT